MEELVTTLSLWISNYGYDNGFQGPKIGDKKEAFLKWLDGQGGMPRDHWRQLLDQDYKYSPSFYTVWRVCAVVGGQVVIGGNSLILERRDEERIQISWPAK